MPPATKAWGPYLLARWLMDREPPPEVDKCPTLGPGSNKDASHEDDG